MICAPCCVGNHLECNTVMVTSEDQTEHSLKRKYVGCACRHRPPVKVELPAPNEDIFQRFTMEIITLAKSEIIELVATYVKLIETGETDRLCRCAWDVHHEDRDKPSGQRRVRIGVPAYDCPVHVKDGFILGFFDWYSKGTMDYSGRCPCTATSQCALHD